MSLRVDARFGISRRTFLAAALASALPAPGAARRDIPWIAWVKAPDGFTEVAGYLRQEFAKHGMVGGRDFTLTFELMRAEFDAVADERLRQLVAMHPDVIAGPASFQLWLLKRLTRDIPIVFHNLTGDPAKLGLVESLRRPGGNITGTSHVQVWRSRMVGLLREFNPALTVVGHVRNEHAPPPEYVRELFGRLKAEAREEDAGWGIEVREIVLPKDVSANRIASAVHGAAVQALMINLPMTPELGRFLESSPLPSVGMSFGAVRKGLLMGISFDAEEGLQQLVAMIVRILRGESPATIPIYQHMRYALAVNMRTAAKAGIRVPDSILMQAIEVIR